MSKYKYKKSGVEWLGDVPEGWIIGKLRWYIDIASGEGLSNLKFEKEKNNLNLYKVVGGNGVLGFTAKVNTTKKVFIIGRVGALCGNVHFFNEKCWITDNALKISFWKNFNDKFFFYLLFASKLNNYASKSAQPLITGEQVKSLKVVIPSNEEQKQISTYLNQKTQKIDTLIKKQQTLIKLLKEKRQALISHAVTKGLDDSVEMKESGVAWLGDVPIHWEVYHLKYAVKKIGDIDHSMPKSVSLGKPYLMTKDISEKASLIDFSNAKQISEADYLKLSKKIKPKKGDLIFARYATIGTISYVDIEKDFLVSYACVTIKPRAEKISGKYLFYFFKSNYFFDEIKRYINSNTQGNIGIDSLYKSRVVISPLTEQLKIVSYLDQKTKQIDTLISKSTQAIELLKERRTALISAVVTGKVDVREDI